MYSQLYPNNVAFGEVQGEVDGVKAYSNGNDGHFSGVRNIDERIFTGFRWQCVEFSRRWLLERKGLLLPDVPWAVHIFAMTSVECVKTGSRVPMKSVLNGKTFKPEKDTLLIYPNIDEAPVGHVAVITEVGEDYIRIADQNQHFHKWKGNYSAELKMIHDKEAGTYTIKDAIDGVPFDPLGWMTFPETPNRDPHAPLEWHEKYVPPTYEKMRLDRKTIVPTATKDNWLDLTNPAEKKFVDTFGMDVSRSRLNEDQANYYMGNFELVLRCIEAGGVLHDIFVKESAKVIASDDLLKLFGIPQEFWGRVRKSFATQPHSITGRFDFVVDHDDNLKCFEYNADSASTLLECGRIQDKYADSVGIAEGTRSSGFRIESLLKLAWKNTGLAEGSRVHFCIDDDDEEEYTALYVIEHAEKSGLKGKLCKMFDGFKFAASPDGSGKILVVDDENVQVKTIWKTWAWETAFSDYFQAKEARGAGWVPAVGEKVRLCDLLLGDEDIVVFEPLWKVIPSNKAILPMIYDSNPNCRFILPASYEVTDALRKTGYATKPIVGRTGQNITITSSDGQTLKQSEGKFSDREYVFQQKFDIPKRDDYYAILGAWIIGGETAGVGIREDKTIITGVESPFSALRFAFPKPPTAEDETENA